MEKSQIGGNTAPTAVQRTPTEVWLMALLIAVESPLSPRSGDDVIDGKIVFSTCCHSHGRFERIEALRTQLRLVCREWNVILKDLGHHFAFIRLGYHEPVELKGDKSWKIRRIEASKRRCPECKDSHYPRSKDSGLYFSLFTLEDPQWVESLVTYDCQTDMECRFFMKVLDGSPRLQALEIWGIQSEYFTNILNHQALTRVTHLSIGLRGEGYEGQLCFPAVEHLHFTMIYRSLSDVLPDWRFPSLRNFHFYYDEGFVQGDLFEGLEQFIALHGEKITSLLIEYVRSDSWPYHSEKYFWKLFPNLHLLGPRMGTLHSLTPPPTNSKLTSLAIPGRDIRGPTSKKFRFDMYVDDLLIACQTLRVRRLVMTDSWEDMTNRSPYMTTETSCWSSRLFDAAAENGITIFDSDRIPFSDEKARQFINGLRDPSELEQHYFIFAKRLRGCS